MRLCVGAGSRRVVEEAAKLKVPQIVASRRQVTPDGGYTGLNNEQLVETVRRLSGGETSVVRDHGGPYQDGNKDDDWVAAFDADVAAGFDALHIDVCKMQHTDQPEELVRLVQRYAGKVEIEIGGERDPQEWLDVLLDRVVAGEGYVPSFAVADVGGHIWADRQRGRFKTVRWVQDLSDAYHELGVKVKAHNCDWAGNRQDYAHVLDAVNIAPEYANVEIDAWLRALSPEDAHSLLGYGYNTLSWRRWFGEREGTTFERSRAALRYHLEDPEVTSILEKAGWAADEYVRGEIREALTAG